VSTPRRPYNAANIGALEAQAATLLAEFVAFGAERVEPSIVQPADAFLDRMGEELRSQTYVFTGPDGAEMCLRPDLTIPAAQIYLSRVPDCSSPLKLCYAGPVFRHDPAAPEQAGQSWQAGVESFSVANTAAKDIEVLMLTHKALQKTGLRSSSITIGDVNLFRAMLEALGLPANAAARIRRHAWHPKRLRDLLQRMTSDAGQENQFAASLKGQQPQRAREMLRDAMGLSGIRVIGTRSFDEIADRMIERASDAATARLSPAAAATIESFLSLRASAKTCVASIRKLADASAVKMDAALDALQQRLDLLASGGIDLARLEYASQFGRNMEYYSGFVFELRAQSLAQPVAGGGRYDGLLSSLGAAKPTPAIGLAVFCDRLLAAVGQQAGRP
jgi:ATP phosphoribosyltransferase regulatory subunit